MCYICKCFGWMIDVVQRVLTFALACIMMTALCIGISMAIIAGVAYGYHYSMAEFLTFTRQDVAVYVRRGQFQDRPDLARKFRRTGDNEEPFASNSSMDYPDQKMRSDSQPLADAWEQTQDSKKYAQKLTKYSYEDLQRKKPELQSWTARSLIFSTVKSIQRQEPQAMPNQRPTQMVSRVSPPTRILSVRPHLGLPTAVIPGRTDIIMRSFRPVDFKNYEPTNTPTTTTDDYFYDDPKKSETISKDHKDKPPDIKISVGDNESKPNYVPMRHWGITKIPMKDFTVDDVDEDNIVYKPV